MLNSIKSIVAQFAGNLATCPLLFLAYAKNTPESSHLCDPGVEGIAFDGENRAVQDHSPVQSGIGDFEINAPIPASASRAIMFSAMACPA